MLKKTISLAIFTCLFHQISFSQKIMHSFGATISVLYGRINTPSSSSGFTLSQTNLTYFPRFNFIENENSSISVGFPVGVGIGMVSNTYGDDVGLSFTYDLPAALDYNIGFKSTVDNEKNFGAYFGAGFGYYKVNISQSKYSDFNGASYGPLL